VTQHGEVRGVLLDVVSYQKMRNAMSLMRLLQVSETTITEGKIRNHDDVFVELGQCIERA
jgi:hypothetical protein